MNLAVAELRLRSEPTKDDIRRVREMVEGTGFFNAAEVAIAAELVEQRLSRGLRSGYEFIFAEREGKLVGYTCFGHVDGTACAYDLYWIAVDKSLHRKRIGRTLIETTELEIVRRGGGRIYVETSSRALYEPTRKFYLRCGYTEVARLQDFYAPGDDKIILLKVVPPAS